MTGRELASMVRGVPVPGAESCAVTGAQGGECSPACSRYSRQVPCGREFLDLFGTVLDMWGSVPVPFCPVWPLSPQHRTALLSLTLEEAMFG